MLNFASCEYTSLSYKILCSETGGGGGVLNFASCEYQGFICWEWALFWYTHHGGLGAYPIKFFLKSICQIFEQGKVTGLPLWE